MNRFSTLFLGLALGATTLLSTACAAPAGTPDVQGQVAQAGQPGGLTRAQVRAEAELARQRGELQAGHAWGYDIPPAPVGQALR